MKNLTISHMAERQRILSELINSVPEPDQQQYSSVKISLINNSIVFPLPEAFQIDDFCGQISDFVNNDLKAQATLDNIGSDIYSVTFSPIGLGLMKKAVVFMLLDSHLYVNIVPIKEIANANYKEGAISGLLSSGKTDKILDFVENYIMSLYAAMPEPPQTAPYGRYFFTTSIGLSTIFASHLEPGEKILAKLDIYKIEQSKSNASTQPSGTDEAFYLCTTSGAYLMVIDDNLQEKYIETLSGQEMKVTSRLGRDLVSCGASQWLCNRDNNNLFAEVAPICNLPADEKLAAFARLHFNNAESPDDKICSSALLMSIADSSQSIFDKFAASFIEYCAYIPESGEKLQQVGQKLIEYANSLLSETDFENRIKSFASQFQFSAVEIMSLIFVICRAKRMIESPDAFADMLNYLKERYYKADSDSINRGFACLSIAAKLNMAGIKEHAFKMASDAFDLFGHNAAAMLAPEKNQLPDYYFSGDSLSYAALGELLKASQTDSDKLKCACEMLAIKPLIKANFDNVIKFSKDDMLSYRVNSAMSIFEPGILNAPNLAQDSGIEGRFGKMSGYMPKCTQWRETYSGLEAWIKKAVPDKALSSVKGHGTLVDDTNYHFLFELGSRLGKFFGLEDVDIYVFSKRGQGITACDDGEGKYILVDGELLDISHPNYLNGSELTFAMAREYAALKLGIARLSCHAQWRHFAELGAQSLDVVKSFAGEPDFIASDIEHYSRVLNFGKLISADGYFQFDVQDAQKASKLMSSTLEALLFKGKGKPADLREREYSALSRLTALIADRVAIMLSGNIQAAIKAIVRTDSQSRQKDPADNSASVSQYICSLSPDGTPENIDLAFRISNLISFYVSDDYKKY